jgi:hypothetical protein
MNRRLIYLSYASGPMDEDELSAILAASRRNNERDGLTGLLLYHEGRFLQCLEGPKEVLMRTLIRIRLDSRHRGVHVLLDEEKEGRLFAGWQMGFESNLAGERLEGFVELARRAENPTGSEAINDLIDVYFGKARKAA